MCALTLTKPLLIDAVINIVDIEETAVGEYTYSNS